MIKKSVSMFKFANSRTKFDLFPIGLNASTGYKRENSLKNLSFRFMLRI